ncbi:MAG TPA: 50S ribosomal protein L11 methyltransferase [Candidatus Eubacterium pullicola]|nr:50S ribosomal protein L11 methyltransferase [Candidatus Eubacterium pullicola]
MRYLQTQIYTTDTGIEELTGLLMRFNIDQTVVESPETAHEILDKKHDYEWDYVDEDFIDDNAEPKITFYLTDDEDGRKLLNMVKEAVIHMAKEDGEGVLGRLEIETTVVDDGQWKDSYKEHFRTIDLTDNIIVKPSWEPVPENNTKKVLELDPGMAFGTGDHATTSMCAVLMDEAGCEGKKVLDIGTGSGILAIAADLLGASDILGVDIDPSALEVAIENAEANGCGDNVRFIEGDLTKGIDFRADIVVANLMAEMVVMLISSVRKHLLPEGVFISSGILVEKKDMVIEALDKAGFETVKVMEKGEWCAILAR